MELKSIKYTELPNKVRIIEFFYGVRNYLFPNYFDESINQVELLNLSKNMFSLYISKDPKQLEEFYNELPNVYRSLITDLNWTYESDPACQSMEEALISYPGVYAVIAYRIAHIFYNLGLKTVARIIGEHAHSKTGIDINPGATIGDYFFIDHGTGVVIGETTIIGHHVKLYQGVTLGAKTIVNAREMIGVKRHPTIGNYVTIYANASILGGDTIVGDNVIIGGNVFIVSSVPSDCKVIYKENVITHTKK